MTLQINRPSLSLASQRLAARPATIADTSAKPKVATPTPLAAKVATTSAASSPGVSAGVGGASAPAVARANTSQPPQLLGAMGLNYGSAPAAQTPLNTQDIKKDYIVGALPTGPEAAQMMNQGIADIFNPGWQQLVAQAAQQNGGLGNEQDGFLAFSSDYGFIRLNNPRLTPEQNRRMAEISLTTGWPVERLPSRTSETGPEMQAWVDEFTGKYDTAMNNFLANPTGGLAIKDTRMRYNMQVDPASGMVVSYQYKKAGGIKGFFQGAMKYISPIADVVSAVGSFIPGIGQVVALCAQGVKMVGSWIATGKAKLGQALSFVGSCIPGLGTGLSATQAAAVAGLAHAAGDEIDTGKFSWQSLAQAVAPSLIQGLPGGASVDQAVQDALQIAGRAADSGRIDYGSVLSALTPLGQAAADSLGISLPQSGGNSAGAANRGGVEQSIIDWLGIDTGTFDAIKGVGQVAIQAIMKGKLSASSLAGLAGPLASQLTNDSQEQATISQVARAIADAVDNHRLNLNDLGSLLLGFLSDRASATSPAVP